MKRTKAVFLDRDGVLNEEKNYICKPEELELYDFAADAIKKINEFEYLAIVITNQSAVARNLCTLSELEAVHDELKNKLEQHHAYLDAIYCCPHFYLKSSSELNPEYNINCDCRKPKPGMFFKAAEDFGINLSESYMIGDSERDILAGQNAGCRTIGVRTGYGMKKSSIKPDNIYDNLLQAVEFIITK